MPIFPARNASTNSWWSRCTRAAYSTAKSLIPATKARRLPSRQPATASSTWKFTSDWSLSSSEAQCTFAVALPSCSTTDAISVGYVVSEMSPYEVDLDWGELNEPTDIASVVEQLGRATAKVHCASDEDSEQDLVDFQVEEAIARSVEGRRREFTAWVTDFGMTYAEQVREDHAHFVHAFREGRIGVSST